MGVSKDDVLVRRDTYERAIEASSGEKFRATFRALNAGDRAEFNEVKLIAGEDASVPYGTIQILMVVRALVEWDISDLPITEDTVRALDPNVFDRLFEAVSLGNPKLEELDRLRDASPTDAPAKPEPESEPETADRGGSDEATS